MSDQSTFRIASFRSTSFHAACRAAMPAILCGLAVVSGCAPRNKAGVTGTVTLGGAPVENVRVMFVPERGPGAAGNTGADGGYVLHAGPRDKNWVVTGRCGVFFSDLNATVPGTSRLPERYESEQTSGFTVELTAGPNVCNFDLDAKTKK